ncbi:MAG: hypothetical protein ABEI27_02090, partial [Halobellus sp.]|uniref:hypothetical protein n=1 Tax=Halobellus sp. TaxID=1979212 RepID=UPI0035D3E034
GGFASPDPGSAVSAARIAQHTDADHSLVARFCGVPHVGGDCDERASDAGAPAHSFSIEFKHRGIE